MKKILMVASEASPFAKTGGLADVIGGLPPALAKRGADVRVIMPKYEFAGKSKKLVKDESTGLWEESEEKKTLTDILSENNITIEHLCHFYVNLGWRTLYCGIEQTVYRGITYYFIDNEFYFKRDNCYGYGDDAERFAFFCRAVLEAIPHLSFTPDIIHCHDWQAGMVPVLLEAQYRGLDRYCDIRTMFTIHNLKFQGVYGISEMKDWFGLGDEYFTNDKLEFYGAGSFMKGALVYTNLITTVSDTYAEEIKYPYYGERLEGLLKARERDLSGIVNGIDYEQFNPKTDIFLYKNYTKSTLKDKLVNKAELQKSLGLSVNEDVPMIGLVSRLTDQKGLALIECVFDEIMQEDVQFVILGNGDKKYEELFKNAVHRYPGKVSVKIAYSDPRAQRIYAASDFFLMPSLFEPCGLGQLISMRYGTLPIVRETGGLKDTVNSYNEASGEGNGFSFTNYNAHDMLYTIQRALAIYKKKTLRTKLVKAAMSCDNSWDIPSGKYMELYNKLRPQLNE
ncbi:MAG: glycogen synthase [Firmicutes bacterium]|nr:glycogen synthase [Bacillota bacterium]